MNPADSDPRVLVVDHCRTVRNLVMKQLREVGFDDVHEAADGDAALRMLLREEFGCLITDLKMPGLSGLQLVRSIRAHPRLKRLPVLLITTEASREHVQEAVTLGVDGFLVKPFSAFQLFKKIQRAVASNIAA